MIIYAKKIPFRLRVMLCFFVGLILFTAIRILLA